MVKRYDPSISIPVVHPVEDVYDFENLEKEKFNVVQKIHTVRAFKELDKEMPKVQSFRVY